MSNSKFNEHNAQIRKANSRKDGLTDAENAERLLNDPAFARAHDMLRNAFIEELEMLQHDGRDETTAYEEELCRGLRTLRSIKRLLSQAVQKKTLRLAEFRPQPFNEDN